jgi:hypothetical protein
MPSGRPTNDANDGTMHQAAAGIFAALPDDPFGDEQDEAPAGTEAPKAAPPAADESQSDEDFDDEGVEALQGDEPEDEDADYDEDEDEDESEDDDEDEGYEEPSKDPVFTVRVNGEDVEVTESELLAGYSRTASWTQKSQALAQERKAFEAQQQAVERERAQYGQGLQALEQQLAADMPRRPTGNDPAAWVEYTRKREELAEVQSKLTAVQYAARQDYEAKQAAHVAAENEKLVELIPEWRDSDVALAEKNGLAKYALGLGYTEEEIEGITDHRAILLLKAAKAYDDLGDAKKAVKSKASKARTLKPGQAKKQSPAARKKSKKSRSQRDNLKESGHVRDAAAYIHDTLLGDEF